MSIFIFLYGLFFALPLTALDIFPFGIKIDDVILISLLSALVLKSVFSSGDGIINKYSLLFLMLTLTASTLSFLISNLNFDSYLGDTAITVYFRVIQSLLIVLFMSLICNNKDFVGKLKWGILCGSLISLVVFMCFFIMHFDFSKFSYRGVYFTKDIFQYSKYLPFSIHVNTLSSFFLISFFLLYLNNKKYRYFSFLFILPSFLLIGKGDILAIVVFFTLLVLSKLKNKYLFCACVAIIIILLSPYLYNEYQSLSQYRVYTSGRNELYGTALQEILMNPFGYGLGSQNNILFAMTGINYPAHNVFLSLSIEFGVFYSLLLSFLMIYWLVKSQDNINKYVFIAFLIIGLFGNAMYFYKYHTLAIFLSLFSLWRAAIDENSSDSK